MVITVEQAHKAVVTLETSVPSECPVQETEKEAMVKDPSMADQGTNCHIINFSTLSQ